MDRRLIYLFCFGLVAGSLGALVPGTNSLPAFAQEKPAESQPSDMPAPRGPSDRGAASFVEGFEDVPLMPALHNKPEESVVFDAASGRIVESLAEGRATAEEVSAFYAESLPSLGWRAAGPGLYEREGEQLRLDIHPAANGMVSVRFFLSPRAPGS